MAFQRQETNKMTEPPRYYRGSLQKEYYAESYLEDKDRKQKAFAIGLA